MLQQELETAISLARLAGKSILKHYVDGFETEEKLGADNFSEPVTIADKIASKIIVEGDSTTTLENARNVAPIVAALDGQKVLLTSDLHMYRAIKVFQKAGISVRPRPFPEALKRAASWRGRWPVFFDLAEETGKIAYYRWNCWI